MAIFVDGMFSVMTRLTLRVFSGLKRIVRIFTNNQLSLIRTNTSRGSISRRQLCAQSMLQWHGHPTGSVRLIVIATAIGNWSRSRSTNTRMAWLIDLPRACLFRSSSLSTSLIVGHLRFFFLKDKWKKKLGHGLHLATHLCAGGGGGGVNRRLFTTPPPPHLFVPLSLSLFLSLPSSRRTRAAERSCDPWRFRCWSVKRDSLSCYSARFCTDSRHVIPLSWFVLSWNSTIKQGFSLRIQKVT